MEKIVRLDEYRARALEKKAYGTWEKRFSESFPAAVTLAELSDRTLYALAQPGDESSLAFYELIMGVLEMGPAAKFHYMTNDAQMQVVEVHLFLADQTRFEMMRRLDWLTALPCEKLSLVEMVLNHEILQSRSRAMPPQLNETHSAFETYQRLVEGDKQVFIRQLLNEALTAFKDRCNLDA